MDDIKLPDQLLRVPQVASVLNISRAQTYRLIKLSKIPARFFGKLVRVRRIDLENLIDGNGAPESDNQPGD